MKKSLVLLHLDKRNWYSFVPLLNSLDASGLDLDVLLSRNPIADLQGLPKERDFVICCFSFLTTQLKATRNLISEIRSRFGSYVKLVAGGSHATGFPEETLKMGFDAVVMGEGELVFPQIIKRLTGGGDSLGDEWPIVKGRPLPDLDMFPPVSFKHHLYPPLEITRGCLFRCRYCSVPYSFGSIRHRSVDSIAKVSERLIKLRRRWDFRFISPNSLGYGSSSRRPNEGAVEDLLESLRNLKGGKRIYFATFPSEARPDFVTERMVEIIADLADNRRISLGAQSGSERMLKDIKRGHDLAAIYKATEITICGGLIPVVDFILGLPGESEADQRETLDAMREIIRMGGGVRVHHFLPLAGSPMAGMKPSKISSSIVKEIGRMALRGEAFGSFTEQMRLAREISG